MRPKMVLYLATRMSPTYGALCEKDSRGSRLVTIIHQHRCRVPLSGDWRRRTWGSKNYTFVPQCTNSYWLLLLLWKEVHSEKQETRVDASYFSLQYYEYLAVDTSSIYLKKRHKMIKQRRPRVYMRN